MNCGGYPAQTRGVPPVTRGAAPGLTQSLPKPIEDALSGVDNMADDILHTVQKAVQDSGNMVESIVHEIEKTVNSIKVPHITRHGLPGPHTTRDGTYENPYKPRTYDHDTSVPVSPPQQVPVSPPPQAPISPPPQAPINPPPQPPISPPPQAPITISPPPQNQYQPTYGSTSGIPTFLESDTQQQRAQKNTQMAAIINRQIQKLDQLERVLDKHIAENANEPGPMLPMRETTFNVQGLSLPSFCTSSQYR